MRGGVEGCGGVEGWWGGGVGGGVGRVEGGGGVGGWWRGVEGLDGVVRLFSVRCVAARFGAVR